MELAPQVKETDLAEAPDLTSLDEASVFFAPATKRVLALGKAVFNGSVTLLLGFLWTVTVLPTTLLDVGFSLFWVDCEWLIEAFAGGLVWKGVVPFNFTALAEFVALTVFMTALLLLGSDGLTFSWETTTGFLFAEELLPSVSSCVFQKEFILDGIILPR